MANARNYDPGGHLVFGAINKFWYTNYRGEREWRTAIPLSLRHGTTEHHPEPGWLLEAYDVTRQAMRTFSLTDIEPLAKIGDQGHAHHDQERRHGVPPVRDDAAGR